MKVCTENEGVVFSKMVGDRNVTSHKYDHDAAREIVSNAPAYYDLMISLLNRIEKEIF